VSKAALLVLVVTSAFLFGGCDCDDSDVEIVTIYISDEDDLEREATRYSCSAKPLACRIDDPCDDSLCVEKLMEMCGDDDFLGCDLNPEDGQITVRCYEP